MVSKKKKDSMEMTTKPPSPPRASLRELYRYASPFDMILLFVGILSAVVTGVAFPTMGIIIGGVTQDFMNVMPIYGNWPIPNGTIPPPPGPIIDKFKHDVEQNCLKYVYIGAFVFAVSCIQSLCFLTVCDNMVIRLRKEFFRAIMRQDITWFDNNHSGSLATKLFDNIERVREGTGDKLGMIFQYSAQFLGGFGVAMHYNWKLTLINMSLVPFIAICGAFIANLMANAAAREAKTYSKAGTIAEEVLSAMRTVIAFNAQLFEKDRYDEALKEGQRSGIRKSAKIGIGMGMTFFILFSNYCLGFWMGTNYVADGTMEGGRVLTCFFSVMMGALALGQAGPQFANVGTALGAAGSLYEVIDREPEIDSYSESGKKPENMKGKISVSNVKFTYPARPDIPILQGISFEANPGETIALVGSSGCGKSTIIQLLLRYYNPAAGKITIDGHPIEDLNVEFLRKYVGVVSQEPVLFNTTIEQNIRYGRDGITDAEITSALRKANAYNFVQNFPDGIQTMVGDRGTQMSGGQKQRIAIARALVRDPKILLLDEATSALDAESEHIVQKALENASQGRTTIVIAHRLSTVKNANKIIAMKGGQVMEVGTHDELIAKKGLYHELVSAQVFADVETKKNVYNRQASALSTKSRSTTLEKDGGMELELGEGDEQAKAALQDLDRLKLELEQEGAQRASLLTILAAARPEWHWLVLGLIAAMVQGLIFPAFSIVFSQIIQVFAKTDLKVLRHQGHEISLVFLYIGILDGVSVFLQSFFFGIAAEGLTRRLRSQVFGNILRQDAYYLDMAKHSPGKISTRLATDAPNIKAAIDYRLGSAINSVFSIIGGVGVSFYYSWRMALFTCGVLLPLMGFGEAAKIQRLQGTAGEDAKSMENSGKVALEAIENIRTVQALTLERRLYAKFCEYVDIPAKTAGRKAVIQSISFGFATSIIFFVLGGVFRLGLYIIVHRIQQPIVIFRVLFAVAFSATTMGLASAYIPEYGKATFAAGLMFNMINEEPRIDGMSKNGKKPKISGKIKFENVQFHYPERPTVPILRGLDLQVNPGETLALVGPSGCGKSTVIGLLERLYDPLSGSVNVDGEDLREVNPTHIRSHIALVSQEPTLFDRSIRSNIVYGLPEGSISEKEILEAAKKANIHSFVKTLPDGYETRVGDKGTQLSGGQKQRIAIARALVRNPKILLLDEATSALDTESEKLVQDALDKASEGRTCIVVAHRLSTVKNANCIMVVTEGKVIEQGTHQQLMEKRGAYWNLTQKQSNTRNQ